MFQHNTDPLLWPVIAADIPQEGEDELTFGTQVCSISIMKCYHSSFTIQVPCVDLFSEQVQLHSAIIVQLKARWPCAKHQGENGGGGHCYIAHNGDHVGLNNCRFKIWVSAIVGCVLYNLLLKSD